MSAGSILETKFHDSEDGTIQYRALSGFAVAALLLGIASSVALASPLLWVVPALGCAAAGLALWSINRNPTQLTGRALAIAGLALSVLFGAAAPARLLSHNILLENRAKEFAARWFEFLAAGDAHRAYQLGRPPDWRLPMDERLEGMSTKEMTDDLHKNLLSRPAVQKLLALGDAADLTHVDTKVTRVDSRQSLVMLVYRVRDRNDDQAALFHVTLNLDRTISMVGNEQWQIQTIESDLLANEERSHSSSSLPGF
jgi:hypothetical protein